MITPRFVQNNFLLNIKHYFLYAVHSFFAAFNIPDLDKKATLTPVHPKEGSLNRVS